MTFLRPNIPAANAAKTVPKKKTKAEQKIEEVMHKWKHEGLPGGPDRKGPRGGRKDAPDVPKTKEGQKKAIAIALKYARKKKAKPGSCGR